MLLAVDIGNTQTVIGVYGEGAWAQLWRVTTNKRNTADEIRIQLHMLFSAEGQPIACIKGAVLAGVVPRLTLAWEQAIHYLFSIEALVCSAEIALTAGLFDTDYPCPAEIGADRVADAVAARVLYGSPVVVVDFGTATNIEVIDSSGRFLGGVIAPGLETSAQALFINATKLSATVLKDPGVAIGQSSEQALQAGIVCGESERADGLVRRIFTQLGYNAPVVATGGYAPLIAECSQEITAVNTSLTLEGLRLLYESYVKKLQPNNAVSPF